MEKPPDKLGRAATLLPVLAFLTFAIVPELPVPEILRLPIVLLAFGGILVSAPLGAFASRRQHRNGDPRWWIPFAAGTSGLALAIFSMVGMLNVSEKQKKDQKALEERQKLEAQSPASR